MATRSLTSPLTGSTIQVAEKDADAYVQQGWLDVTSTDLPTPKRGAPKPDLEAGRAALGKSTTAAARKSPATKKDQGAEK